MHSVQITSKRDNIIANHSRPVRLLQVNHAQ